MSAFDSEQNNGAEIATQYGLPSDIRHMFATMWALMKNDESGDTLLLEPRDQQREALRVQLNARGISTQLVGNVSTLHPAYKELMAAVSLQNAMEKPDQESRILGASILKEVGGQFHADVTEKFTELARIWVLLASDAPFNDLAPEIIANSRKLDITRLQEFLATRGMNGSHPAMKRLFQIITKISEATAAREQSGPGL